MNETEYKNIKIDKEELKKQHDKAIKESGHYIEVNILIGKDEKETISGVDVRGVSLKEIARMIKSLEVVKKELCDNFPKAGLIAEFFMNAESKEL